MTENKIIGPKDASGFLTVVLHIQCSVVTWYLGQIYKQAERVET